MGFLSVCVRRRSKISFFMHWPAISALPIIPRMKGSFFVLRVANTATSWSAKTQRARKRAQVTFLTEANLGRIAGRCPQGALFAVWPGQCLAGAFSLESAPSEVSNQRMKCRFSRSGRGQVQVDRRPIEPTVISGHRPLRRLCHQSSVGTELPATFSTRAD
jgi:hypothetical protein